MMAKNSLELVAVGNGDRDGLLTTIGRKWDKIIGQNRFNYVQGQLGPNMRTHLIKGVKPLNLNLLILSWIRSRVKNYQF